MLYLLHFLPAVYSTLPAIDDDPLPDCTSTSRLMLPSAVRLNVPALDESDEDDPFGCRGTPLPFPLRAASYTVPAAGAVSPASRPTSREVTPHDEEGEEEEDDIEVFTGDGTSPSFPHQPALDLTRSTGNSTPSNTFLTKHGQDAAAADSDSNKGTLSLLHFYSFN